MNYEDKIAKYFERWQGYSNTEYETMVGNLFKKWDDNVAMCHHATTGLAGEAAELRAATSFENAQEESGDLRFYMVALRQRLGLRPGGIEETKEVIESPYYRPFHGNILDNIQLITGELLDLTKKSWAYERALKEYEIWQQLTLLEINFQYWANEVMGVDVVLDIEQGNMIKLAKGDKARFPGGIYSDAAALARVDKQ